VAATCAPASLDVVSTDHCPFCMKEQKELGHRRLLQDPQRHRWRRAPDGPASTKEVVEGRISLPRWVELLLHDAGPDVRPAPARRARSCPEATPTMVRLRPGPARTRHLGSTTAHMNMDYSAYEGFEVAGGVDTVVSRGTVVVEGGALRPAARGHGQYLRRGLFVLRRPRSPKTSAREGRNRGLRRVVPSDRPACLGGSSTWRGQSRAGRVFATCGPSTPTCLWQEPYVIYSQILAGRPTASRFGPMVTNPGHPRLDRHRIDVRHAQRDVRQPGPSAAIGRGRLRPCASSNGKPVTFG